MLETSRLAGAAVDTRLTGFYRAALVLEVIDELVDGLGQLEPILARVGEARAPSGGRLVRCGSRGVRDGVAWPRRSRGYYEAECAEAPLHVFDGAAGAFRGSVRHAEVALVERDLDRDSLKEGPQKYPGARRVRLKPRNTRGEREIHRRSMDTLRASHEGVDVARLLGDYRNRWNTGPGGREGARCRCRTIGDRDDGIAPTREAGDRRIESVPVAREYEQDETSRPRFDARRLTSNLLFNARGDLFEEFVRD
jgi:hypothetical protein